MCLFCRSNTPQPHSLYLYPTVPSSLATLFPFYQFKPRLPLFTTLPTHCIVLIKHVTLTVTTITTQPPFLTQQQPKKKRFWSIISWILVRVGHIHQTPLYSFLACVRYSFLRQPWQSNKTVTVLYVSFKRHPLQHINHRFSHQIYIHSSYLNPPHQPTIHYRCNCCYKLRLGSVWW